MESQRVSLLTEGYLRGWLTFKYPLSSSYFREELILRYIEDARLCEVMEHKLLVETTLRGTLQVKDLNPVYETREFLLGLKLPSLKSKDKIKQAPKTQKDFTPEQIAEWKQALADAQKHKKALDAKT